MVLLNRLVSKKKRKSSVYRKISFLSATILALSFVHEANAQSSTPSATSTCTIWPSSNFSGTSKSITATCDATGCSASNSFNLVGTTYNDNVGSVRVKESNDTGSAIRLYKHGYGTSSQELLEIEASDVAQNLNTVSRGNLGSTVSDEASFLYCSASD